MGKFRPFSLSAAFALLLICVFMHSQSWAEVPEGARCNECGMRVGEDSNLISYIVTTEGKTLYFCEAGDMLMHMKHGKPEAGEVHVRDHETGEWMHGKDACYLKDDSLKTPMGWNVAAFKDKGKCGPGGPSALGVEGALGLVQKGGRMKMMH